MDRKHGRILLALGLSLAGVIVAGHARALASLGTLTTQIGLEPVMPIAVPNLGDGPPFVTTSTTDTGLDADGFGNAASATATVSAFPGAAVAGSAVATAAVGGAYPSYARSTVAVEYRYGITLTGPSSVSAPIRFEGRTRGSATAAGTTARTVFEYTGGTVSELGVATGSPLVFGVPGIEWILDPSCGLGCGFDHEFTIASTIQSLLPNLSVVLRVEIDLEANEPGESLSASMSIDPYIYLDPAWAAANPEYTLVVDPLVANIPEPSTALLLLTALGGLGGWRRNRVSHAGGHR